MLFPGSMKHQLVGKLSGGERNRVLLAKLLTSGGNVLLLDEPTNDLDLSTLRQLEEALCDFPGAVLVVSHDRWFLDRVATKILVLDGAGGARIVEGSLSDWLKLRTETAPDPVKPEAEPKPALGATVKPTGRKLGYREARELESLPVKITAIEGRLTEIDGRLSDPALYGRPSTERAALARDRADLDRELQTLYTRWQELESAREGAP
jgi:ATP-binding cassette subfamily F protein uup